MLLGMAICECRMCQFDFFLFAMISQQRLFSKQGLIRHIHVLLKIRLEIRLMLSDCDLLPITMLWMA